MKVRITFHDTDLEEALAKHFKIKPNQITEWYIRSCLGNFHYLEFEKENSKHD